MGLARTVAVNTSILVAGRLASAALGIVAVGVATRYLGLDTYGVLATAIGFTAVINMLTDVGLWTIGARELAKRPEETQRVVGGLVTAGLVLSLGAAVIGVAATLAVYGGGHDELVRRGILILLVTLPFSAPYGAASAYFISRQQPWMGMIGSVIASVVTLGLLIAASALDWGFTGVVLAYVAAAVVQWVVMTYLSRGRIRLWPAADLGLTRQLLRWSLPLGGAMVVSSLYWRIDIVLLSALASDAEVGLYGLAYRMVDALVVLPAFITITLLPEFARLTERRERFDEILQKGFSVMQVGAVAMLVPFVVLAPEITGFIGGSEFKDAAPVLQLLMIGVALTYLSGIFGRAIVGLDRQDRLFVISLVILVANVGINIALIPVWGAEGAAVAFALTELIHLAAIAWFYSRFAKLPLPWKPVRVLAAGGVMAGVAALAKLLPVSGEGGMALIAVVGGALGFVAYIGALYLFRAMPNEVHATLVRPLLARLNPARTPRLARLFGR